MDMSDQVRIFEETGSNISCDHTSGSPAPPAPCLARCDDDFIFEYPKDLYIPPDALHLLLDKFEGPFDLLLYLIRKKELDILEVSVSEVTQQYVTYVHSLFSSHANLSVEYLVMAALLIHLKTSMLLPRPTHHETTEEEEDPRVLLVRRLEEYEKIKRVSLLLSEWPVLGKDFFSPCIRFEDVGCPVSFLPTASIRDISRTWKRMMHRHQKLDPYWLKAQHLSVREYMTAMLRVLHENYTVPLTQFLCETPEVSFVVVYFIAMLQLIRDCLISAEQEGRSNIVLSLIKKDQDVLLDEAIALLEVEE